MPQSIDLSVIGAITERFLREPNAVRFRFVEENCGGVSTERLCRIMNVSPRGFRGFRSRPMSESQRADMVLLAHIREQHKLSLGRYGRPRMTEELKELGFDVGRGSQYCSHDYQKLLRKHGLKASMSGKGNCYDNAAMETFVKTIKAELIWRPHRK